MKSHHKNSIVCPEHRPASSSTDEAPNSRISGISSLPAFQDERREKSATALPGEQDRNAQVTNGFEQHLVSLKELAGILGRSESSVRYHIRMGRIVPAARLGKTYSFDPEEVLRRLKQHCRLE